jgi:cytochrome c553
LREGHAAAEGVSADDARDARLIGRQEELRRSVSHVLVGLTLVALAGTGVSKGRAAASDAKLLAYGRHLSGECSACHRIDGVDNGIPSITGWDPEAFIATMIFYRNGERTNPAMVSVAQSLDEEQYKALAAYYGSLPKPNLAPKKK